MTHPAESWSTLLAAGKLKDTAGFLLSATNRMVIATGIANIWARDPFTITRPGSP